MEHESPNGFKEIKPLPFHHQKSNSVAALKTQSTKLKTLMLILGLIILLCGAIIVIFFLPNWTKNNSAVEMDNDSLIANAPVQTMQDKTIETSSTQSISLSGERAWDIKQRKTAQIYLQDILQQQKILEANHVSVWAKEKYERGLHHINNGDKLYNQQQFDPASIEYRQALNIFNMLIKKINVLYETHIKQGQIALDQGNVELALSAFSTASLFTDESGLATKGLERAKKLDDVFAKIKEGHDAFNEYRLTDARKAYQAALALDPDIKIAKQKLLETNRLLTDRQFKHYMTAGYTALEQKKINVANDRFNHALKIKPGSPEATTALQQVRHQLITNEIDTILQQASEAEKKEQWKEAVDLYDRALKLEPNLAKAQIDKLNAELQLQTYERLQTILSQPVRLSDKNVHAEVTLFYNNTRNTLNQGPIRTRQLEKLETLLKINATPIKIRFESDKQTQITIYKFGKIGVFDSKELELRPGKYVAIGQRDGYRDVRIEFHVLANNKEQVIHIATVEKID